jgi:hypothetical protein
MRFATSERPDSLAAMLNVLAMPLECDAGNDFTDVSGCRARWEGRFQRANEEANQPERRRSYVTKVLEEVLAANARYAGSFGDRAKLPMPPARHFAILTCMDARMDPARFAGLAEGDAHVIRNAGGRASDDAIRSPIISLPEQEAARHRPAPAFA